MCVGVCVCEVACVCLSGDGGSGTSGVVKVCVCDVKVPCWAASPPG